MVLVRYQGYVCPGILVTLAGEEEVSFLQSAWESYSILCPQDLSILRFVKDEINETQKNDTFRLGLSSGCSVTPFPQSSSRSLPTVICSVLLACRQAGVTAGVERIRDGVRLALPSLDDQQLGSLVHRTLRSLIKVIISCIINE